jgi:glycosyltransferase involved in cell wall biosynthesis
MKILHLLYESRGDYFGCGGVGHRAYAIYKRLGTRHDITLLCRKYPGARDGEIDGIKHIFVGRETGNFTLALLSYAKKASRFVKERGEDYDIIVEEFSPAVPTFLNFYRKRPLILQVQAHTGKMYFEKYNLLYATVLYLLEKTRPILYRNFIFVSEATERNFPLFSKERGPVEIIPNGVDEELLTLEQGESDYILYLGRIDIHNKGLDTLIESYKDVYSSYPQIRLVVAGDGRDMKRLREIVEILPRGIQRNIKLAGWVEGERKRDLLRDAMMVIFPSRYESQPIAVLEAVASAKPVIVSRIGGLAFFAEKGGGLSFQAGDSSMLAEKIAEMIKNRNLRISCGMRGRRMAERRRWEEAALHFENYLTELLKTEQKKT